MQHEAAYLMVYCKTPAGGKCPSLSLFSSRSLAAGAGQESPGLLVMMRCCAPRRHQSLTSLATLPPSESHSTLLYGVSLSKAAWSELSKSSKTILRGNKILDGRCDVRRSLTWPRNCETESRERPETWDLVRDSEQWIAPPGEANIDTASGFYREIFHCDNFYWVFDW